MPTDRPSAVSIIVSTTNLDTTSRIPLRRSQARVSASDAGCLRPNDPEIRELGEMSPHKRASGDKRANSRIVGCTEVNLTAHSGLSEEKMGNANKKKEETEKRKPEFHQARSNDFSPLDTRTCESLVALHN